MRALSESARIRVDEVARLLLEQRTDHGAAEESFGAWIGTETTFGVPDAVEHRRSRDAVVHRVAASAAC